MSRHVRVSALLALLLACAASVSVSGVTFAPSTYFSDALKLDPTNPLSWLPFELPAAYETGLANNGTTLNIAVAALCATYNPLFTKAVPAVNTANLLRAQNTSDPLEAGALMVGEIMTMRSMVMTPEEVQQCWTGIGQYNDFYFSFLLLQQRINSMCNGGISAEGAAVGECGIPMRDRYNEATGHQMRVKLNLVFFYTGPLPVPGSPDAGYAVTTGSNIATLANFLANEIPFMGWPLGKFPIVIPPPYGGETFMSFFSIACELSKQCLVVSAYGSSQNYLTCIIQPAVEDPTQDECPLDCIVKYGGCAAAGALTGRRRFDYSVTYLFDQRDQMTYLHTHLKTKSARTVAVLRDGRSSARQINAAITSDLEEKGMKIVYDKTLSTMLGPFGVTAGPALSADEIREMAQELSLLDPDVVEIASDSSQTANMDNFVNLILECKRINWAPRAIVAGAGSYWTVARGLEAAGVRGDGSFVYGSNVNDLALRGRSYQTRSDPAEDAVLTRATPSVNFEPYGFDEATNFYGAQLFREDYVSVFYPDLPPGEADVYQGNILPQVGATMIMIAVKLAELAASDDAAALQLATFRLSVPSLGGLLQFDTMGRLVAVEQPIVQIDADLRYQLITPADVATATDVYPLPTWEQRTFKPEPLKSDSESAVLAVNSLSLAFLATLFVAIAVKRTHPIIKASAPVFCLLSLLGGMLAVASNYGLSMQPTATGCGVNVWLLTFGFTLMISSLLMKLGRLYFIFSSGRLTVVKISNAKLGALLAVVCLVDVLLNAIWTGVAPFASEVVVVDALRPSFNYRQCAWNDAARYLMYTHIAWKALIILAALVLTVKTRDLPAAFNESTYLGASVYNLSVLLIFLVPVVSSKIGGRATTYLLHAFGVQVLVVSTMAILFLPKFYQMRSISQTAKQNGGTYQATLVGGTTQGNATQAGQSVLSSSDSPTTVATTRPSNDAVRPGAGRPANAATSIASPASPVNRGSSRAPAWAPAGAQSPTSMGTVLVRVHPDAPASPPGSDEVVAENAALRAQIEQLRAELEAARNHRRVAARSSSGSIGNPLQQPGGHHYTVTPVSPDGSAPVQGQAEGQAQPDNSTPPGAVEQANTSSSA